jgi:hypothetical protein
MQILHSNQRKVFIKDQLKRRFMFYYFRKTVLKSVYVLMGYNIIQLLDDNMIDK